MISFACDYLEGCHPKILEAFVKTNMTQLTPYGDDFYTKRAIESIRKEIGVPDAEIRFVGGGTQTNKLAIDCLLKPFDGVVAASSGHINCHEAGAIEITGHKVISVPGENGKLTAKSLEKVFLDNEADESALHMVHPGMAYISHPSEYGTLYTKSELTELSEICHNHGAYLYLDGARLGYGLMSDGTDVTIKDIASLCDAFYIGGTKVGAICGEALVFCGKFHPERFLSRVKQHGALFAKGRINGIQFDTLFTEGLYYEISRNAIEKSNRIKKIFQNKGYKLFIDSPSNQQFIIMPDSTIDYLKDKIGFERWERVDETHSAVRFASSWATTNEMVDELERIVPNA